MIPRVLMTSVLALSLIVLACGDDPSPVEIQGDCELTVTSPDPGDVIQLGDGVDVRWRSESTGGRVDVELLKSGQPVAVIVADTADDRYTYWRSGLMGAEPGPGFTIRISSTTEPDCSALSGEFSLFDTDNCGFELTLSDSVMIAGDGLVLTWTSEHTLGLVDLHLLTWEGVQGVIAYGTADDGEYTWPATSFHGGTNEFYRLAISDHTVESCADTSDFIKIVDPDICRFAFASPLTNSEWEVGQTRNLTFSTTNTSGRVSLHLFAGTVYVGLIDSDVNADIGSYEWTVHKFGFVGPDHMFRIGVRDIEDEYCFGRSEMFEILD